jgi:glycosyltransferase involved in cell wall biosynthesis
MVSNTDSFGVVYLEAWASGKPVIACRNTPQEGLIDDGADGLLVEYGNSEELAHAIRQLLSDRGLRSRLGETGRRKVRAHYTWKRIAAQVRDEYRKLVQPLG